MKKLQYENPELEVVTFYADIVTTSGNGVTEGVDCFNDYFDDNWRGNNG